MPDSATQMGGSSMEVFDAMESAMTMRWLKNEPVQDEVIERLIWAGTRASSPANSQLWDFIVVTSPQQRARLHETIEPAIAVPSTDQNRPAQADPVTRRMIEGGTHLLATLQEAPALIFVCASSLVPGDPKEDRYQLAAIYGATQNMLVAARAMGLGVAPTGLHNFNTKGVREALEVPDHKMIGVTMAIGWPDRPFRPLHRKPVADVIHRDTW
jgi:nitroreductase